MGVSKESMLDAFARFKVLQDTANEEKFVAKEAGKGLISDADLTKLAGIETGAQKNPDLSGYATNGKVQLALTTALSIFGGTYTPPDDGGNPDPTPDPDPDPNPNPNPNPEDENDGDEEITDEDLQNLFN